MEQRSMEVAQLISQQSITPKSAELVFSEHRVFTSLASDGVDADSLSTAISSTDTAGFNPLVDIAF